MKSRKITFVLALVSSLIILVPVQAHATVISWSAMLDGAQEVPAVIGSATGSAQGTIDMVTGDLTWAINVGDLMGLPDALTGLPVAAHFHLGASGMNGSAKVDIRALSTTILEFPNVAFYLGSAVIAPGDDLVAFLADGFYINIHTAANPGGEIRGQVIVREPSTLILILLGLIGLGFARKRDEPLASSQ